MARAKKEITYILRGININLEREYKTTDKLRAGSIVSLYSDYRKDTITYKVIGWM